MVCKGICHRYKAKWMTQTARYGDGQKRCNICELFVSWDGAFCPCCGMLLRSRPRSVKGKVFARIQ
jgi:hypothetical protein